MKDNGFTEKDIADRVGSVYSDKLKAAVNSRDADAIKKVIDTEVKLGRDKGAVLDSVKSAFSDDMKQAVTDRNAKEVRDIIGIEKSVGVDTSKVKGSIKDAISDDYKATFNDNDIKSRRVLDNFMKDVGYNDLEVKAHRISFEKGYIRYKVWKEYKKNGYSSALRLANKYVAEYPNTYDKKYIYGAIQDAIRENRILYADKKRSHLFVRGERLQLPNSLYEQDFTDNIEHFWENVKYEVEKKSGKIVTSSGEIKGKTIGDAIAEAQKKKNEDIRYSAKDSWLTHVSTPEQEARKAAKKQLAENDKLQAKITQLKGEFKLTKGMVPDPKKIRQLSDELLKDYTSNVNRDDLIEGLTELYGMMSKKEALTGEELYVCSLQNRIS